MRRRPLLPTLGAARSMRRPFSTSVVCCLAVHVIGWSSEGVNATDVARHHGGGAMQCPMEKWMSPLPDATTCLQRPTRSPTPSHQGTHDTNWLLQSLTDVSSLFTNTTLFDVLSQPTDWVEIQVCFTACVIDTWKAVVAWIYLAKLLSIPVLTGLLMVMEALMPHTRSLVHSAYLTFRSLDPVHQATAVVITLGVLITWRKGYFARVRMAWKRVKLRWRQAQRNFRLQVAAKSKVAAYILPHAIYAMLCHVIATLSPAPVLALLSHEVILVWLATIYPIMMSIRAVRTHRYTDDPAAVYFERSLRYWILWAFYLTSHSIATTLVPHFIVFYFKPSILRINFLLNWLHHMHGTRVLLGFAVNYVFPHGATSGFSPTRSMSVIAAPPAHAGIVFRTLTAVGLISTRTANIMRDVMAQGPAIFGLVFLVTPGFLTKVGCDAVALAFPAYVVLGTLARHQRRTHEWWVCYFVVVAIVEYLFDAMSGVLWWVPFVYHIKLVGMLWLQFPYFRGAQTLFDLCFHSVLIDPRRAATPPLERIDHADGPTEARTSSHIEVS
ncbi:hypothetical protein H310_01072 [Aphanomyces invadans]|uniref:Uncharacterized protein n=1 Tax=Aphanomyces invadans TaxID=157072 RepID=A0A024URN5_9STRA|nr:hypothetical protein H310_01072 [Aphanomyces invadans]ETW08507.1 hypothetical protein H310_01072 [Aphanomyces invadans]|eukprot:XP_008862312.1 hypothetical protein H310_01072 [Aphanomyces invadans]